MFIPFFGMCNGIYLVSHSWSWDDWDSFALRKIMLFKSSLSPTSTQQTVYKKQFAFLAVHYLVRYMPQMLYSSSKIIKQSVNDRGTIILKMARSSKKVVNIELQSISSVSLQVSCTQHCNCKMWDSSCVSRRDLYL